MNEFWRQAEGQRLDGMYNLGASLGGAEDSAVFPTQSQEGRPAAVKIWRGEDGDAALAGVREAAGLAHPHLIPIWATGRSELGGKPVVYAVMERADENLAGVLEARALSEAEIREMLSPALEALVWLHEKGFVHGAMRPSNVMAAGETLKLSSDQIQRAGATTAAFGGSVYDAPSDEPGVAVASADVWALGVLLFYASTRQFPEWGESASGAPINLDAVPAGIADIVEHCLRFEPSGRWTVGEIRSALNGGKKAAAADSLPEPVAATPVKPVEPVRVVEPVRPEPVREAPARLAAPLRSRYLDEVEKPARERPQWLIPVAVLLALAVLIVSWMAAKTGGAGPRTVTKAGEAPVAGAAAVTTPAPIATPAPAPAAAAVSKPAARDSRGGHGNTWFVVVATYVDRGAANHRAAEISRRFPRFQARVYAPPVTNPHHLVVIGENLTEEQADALRTRARAAGLPRDVYIKKFPG